MPKFTLKCHGTGARLSPRAMALFSNLNLVLINPRLADVYRLFSNLNLGLINPRLADVYRLFEERLDRQLNRMKRHFVEPTEKMIVTRQHSASLEHDEAGQSRLATEADIPADKKTRKRTEGTAAADRAKHDIGDSSSAQVDPGPTSSTRFGMKAEPHAFPCRDDALVDKSAAAPKPCLSPAEMRTLTAAGDLLLAGRASTVTRIIF